MNKYNKIIYKIKKLLILLIIHYGNEAIRLPCVLIHNNNLYFFLKSLSLHT